MLCLCWLCYVNDQLNTSKMFFCALLINYPKAFDKVRHSELLITLKRIGIDVKVFRIIRNL